MNVPGWFKVFAVALAGLMGAALSVPYRWVRAPKSSGSDQPRAHFNTKNTTRFVGTDLTETASPVAHAVYPGTTAANTPDLVIIYDDPDWRAGPAASSLLRPLNGLLLPADFPMNGSEPFGGAQALLVDRSALALTRGQLYLAMGGRLCCLPNCPTGCD